MANCPNPHKSHWPNVHLPVVHWPIVRWSIVPDSFKITDCASTKNLTKTLIKSSEPKCLRFFVKKLMILLQSYCKQERKTSYRLIW